MVPLLSRSSPLPSRHPSSRALRPATRCQLPDPHYSTTVLDHLITVLDNVSYTVSLVRSPLVSPRATRFVCQTLALKSLHIDRALALGAA